MKHIMISIFLLIMTFSSVSAHPGHVGSEGGHTCREDCEEYDLEYLEYHYHTKVDGEYDYSTHLTVEEYEYNLTREESINSSSATTTQVDNSQKEAYKIIFTNSLSEKLAELSDATLELFIAKIDTILAKDLSDTRRAKIEALQEVLEEVLESKATTNPAIDSSTL